MYRWIAVLLLLGGLVLTGYVSHRGVTPGGPVTSLEDGSGFPTPRPAP